MKGAHGLRHDLGLSKAPRAKVHWPCALPPYSTSCCVWSAHGSLVWSSSTPNGRCSLTCGCVAVGWCARTAAGPPPLGTTGNRGRRRGGRWTSACGGCSCGRGCGVWRVVRAAASRWRRCRSRATGRGTRVTSRTLSPGWWRTPTRPPSPGCVASTGGPPARSSRVSWPTSSTTLAWMRCMTSAWTRWPTASSITI